MVELPCNDPEGCVHFKREQQLQAELDKHRWIPVTERLPKIGQEVLLYSVKFEGSKLCVLIWWREALEELVEFTHWKPITLPEEALKEKEDESITN